MNTKVSRTIQESINAYLPIKLIQRKWIIFLKKGFNNTFKFLNNDINKFILLLKRVVYPYHYMDE